MPGSRVRADIPALSKLVIPCLLVAILAGCGHVGNYLGFWERQNDLKKEFHEEPRAELLRELDPENCFFLVGLVSLTSDYQGPVLLVAVSDTFKKREIVAMSILQVPIHYYQVYLPEGRYDLYFFADLDGNGYFDAYEMIGQTAGLPIKISKTAIKDNPTVYGPTLSLNPNRPATAALSVKVRVEGRSNAYIPLSDEFFAPRYGMMGLYDPRAMMSHTQRYFFSLEKFDPGKTIVFFVHGVGGTPRDFEYLVDGLDKSRYQPWFYFYPSGMPLQKLGSLFARFLELMEKTEGYQPRRIVVVAHSMGGLVALSALNQLSQDGMPPYLKGFVSFDSPYGGVEEAKNAVEKAPAVVPSWRDVATGSPFLNRLYQGQAGKEIPFFLFFGYQDGKSGDGTITLQSQLEPKVYFTASRSYGFNVTHVGMLKDDKVRQTFNRVLAMLGD
jgi:pimeloyl-ACP methyl ester carboxylesterase